MGSQVVAVESGRLCEQRNVLHDLRELSHNAFVLSQRLLDFVVEYLIKCSNYEAHSDVFVGDHPLEPVVVAQSQKTVLPYSICHAQPVLLPSHPRRHQRHVVIG
jgi:hypothetical protein